MTNYLTKIKEFLYRKDILPIIIRERHLQPYSLEKMMEREPLPDEQSRPPYQFAKNLALILGNN